MMASFKPYIDFYSEHAISPVHQAIDSDNLIKHMQRRSALYRHLGIVPGLIRDKTVLEFGPGSGHNALYTNALSPNHYVLVDGNPTGLNEAKQLLSAHGSVDHVEFVHSLIEEFTTEQRFDLVLCEALIAFQLKPVEFAKKPAQYVTSGGLFVVTCTDSVAVLADWMRRLYGAILVNSESQVDNQLNILRPFFTPHLNTLAGMSRPIDDWLLDNVIQCLSPNIGRGLFSIPEAIDSLSDDFDAYQSSPAFNTDWRWYKNIYGDELDYNKRFKSAYGENLHSMLDYRFNYPPRSVDLNCDLKNSCDKAFQLIHDMLRLNQVTDPERVSELRGVMFSLADHVSGFSRSTARAITEYADFLDKIDAAAEFSFSEFTSFWGRGTQYLSLIRR